MESKLKIVRESKGFTQVQVAIKAQISVRGYQRIEAGTRVPNVQTAQRIAQVLNTKVEDIFPLPGQDAIAQEAEPSIQNYSSLKL